MTGILFDLNTLVKHIDDLTQRVGQTETKFVYNVFRTRDAYTVKKILELSAKLNLTDSIDEKISLKEDGKNLLEERTYLNGLYYDDPNDTQIKFLKEKFFAGEQFLEEFKDIMKEFWSDYKNAELVCKFDGEHGLDRYIVAYLKEIQIPLRIIIS